MPGLGRGAPFCDHVAPLIVGINGLNVADVLRFEQPTAPMSIDEWNRATPAPGSENSRDGSPPQIGSTIV